MPTGESHPKHVSDTAPPALVRSELDLVIRIADFKSTLAARAADLKRREAALVEGTALPRVSAGYFHPGHYSNEDAWWSRQLGSG